MMVGELSPEAGHLGRRFTQNGEQSMGMPDSARRHHHQSLYLGGEPETIEA
jgi:hypothetical protein